MRHFRGLFATDVIFPKTVATFPKGVFGAKAAVLAAGMLLLQGCATAPGGCPAGLSPMTAAELYFGRSLASGEEVTDAEWQSFLDSEITQRFPDGLSVGNVQGQWKGANAIVHERSKHVVIILAGKAPAEKLDAIRKAYKARFHQESVLLLQTQGCGSF